MTEAINNLLAAQKLAEKIRPKVNGFPYLAEALRSAGVTKCLWTLPSCQCIYLTKYGAVIQQGDILLGGIAEIAKFDQDAFLAGLKKSQAGQSTFPEFLRSSWDAGVVRYEVDLENRKVCYFGALDECYVEAYPEVEIKK